MPSVRLRGIHNGRDDAPYHPSPTLLAAANTALLLNTPLLWLANRAAARPTSPGTPREHWRPHFGDPEAKTAKPLECMCAVICGLVICCTSTMPWRFADAQHPRPSDPQRAQDARHYIALQSLGIGLMSPVQRVVLIDEIDKGPRDLPNDLLREMDQGSFTIPEIPEIAAGTIHDSLEAESN